MRRIALWLATPFIALAILATASVVNTKLGIEPAVSAQSQLECAPYYQAVAVGSQHATVTGHNLAGQTPQWTAPYANTPYVAGYNPFQTTYAYPGTYYVFLTTAGNPNAAVCIVQVY